MQLGAVSDAIIAAIMVIYLAYTSIKGARDYKALGAATNAQQRLNFYRSWGAELILLTIAGVGALLLTGRGADLLTFPRALTPLHALLSQPIVAVVFWFCVAVFCALMVFSTISVMKLAPNEANAARAQKILTATPMLARDARERTWGVVMSLFAGAGEEVAFRVLFPIVLFSLTHNLLVAVLVPIATFGIAHAYQGVGGVITTAAVGALMFGVYAATQSLWLVAAFHALVDIRGVVMLGWSLSKLAGAGAETPSHSTLAAAP